MSADMSARNNGITRLNAEERKAIGQITSSWPASSPSGRCVEPAMGTLGERLDILIRRHGGLTRLSTMYDVTRFAS